MITKFLDPVSNISFTVEDHEVFTVLIRRSNGPKKIAFTSKSAAKAFDTYHKLKVFKTDRKFIVAKSDKVDRILLAESGTEIKPSRLNHKGIKSISKMRSTAVIMKLPDTLLEETNRVLSLYASPDTGYKLTRNKLVPLLLAYFCVASHEEIHKILDQSKQEYLKHKYKSGGDNDEEVEKMLMSNKFKDEDLELL